MSAPIQNGNGGPPPQPPILQEDPEAVTNALLRAVRIAAENAAGAMDAREAKELGATALAFAQAIVVLDPGLTQAGVPLAHELAMEQVRQDGMERLEKARQAAAAPTPSKRRLKVRRDDSGRMAEIEEG